MKSAEDVFKIEITGGGLPKRLLIRPMHTTDGVPVYQCHTADGTTIGELRRETSGEWVQLWGDLPVDAVARIGDAIAHYMA